MPHIGCELRGSPTRNPLNRPEATRRSSSFSNDANSPSPSPSPPSSPLRAKRQHVSLKAAVKNYAPMAFVCGLAVSILTVSLFPHDSHQLYDQSAIDRPAATSRGLEIGSNRDKRHGDVCFTTVQMGANGEFPEQMQNLTDLGVRLSSDEANYRYIVFTNDASLDAQDWEKAVVSLDYKKYQRVKTHVTYAKFLGWKEPILNSCRVVFYADGMYVPTPNVTVWEDLESRVIASPSGLLAQRKPKNRTVLYLLDHIHRYKVQKDTEENCNKTRDWLLSRPDFRRDTPSYWANFFGYDPKNAAFRAAADEFWSIYSKEDLTPRDQSLWSYVVQKRNMNPSLVRCVDPPFLEKKPYVNICRMAGFIKCKKEEDSRTCEERFFRLENQYEVDVDASKLRCKHMAGGHVLSGEVTFGSCKWCDQRYGIPNFDGSVCCPKGCGKCGGRTCRSAPGGKEKCCTNDIRLSAKTCTSHNDTACIISSVTKHPPCLEDAPQVDS